jgi:uncharacterized protein (DUF1330 family)
MPAYVIADIMVHDPAGYEAYKPLAAASVAQYGGRYIARGGRTDALEGTWAPNRLVILEFDSLERARAWYDSPEYAPAKKIRQRTATSSAVAVEGLPA